jgi:hypothetical protein
LGERKHPLVLGDRTGTPTGWAGANSSAGLGAIATASGAGDLSAHCHGGGDTLDGVVKGESEFGRRVDASPRNAVASTVPKAEKIADPSEESSEILHPDPLSTCEWAPSPESTKSTAFD